MIALGRLFHLPGSWPITWAERSWSASRPLELKAGRLPELPGTTPGEIPGFLFDSSNAVPLPGWHAARIYHLFRKDTWSLPSNFISKGPKMKKLALIAAATFLFVACDNKPKEEAAKDTSAVVVDTSKKDTVKVDSAKIDSAKKDSAKKASDKK
jgi:hypothetical protein